MKKVLKRLLVLTLVATFALGSAGVFAANDSSIDSTLEKNNLSSSTAEKQVKTVSKKTENVKKIKATGYDIVAPALTYNTTSKPAYRGGNLAVAGYYQIIVRANATGKLYVDGSVSSSSKGSATVYVCSSLDINSGRFTYISPSKTISPGKSGIGAGGLDVVAGRNYNVLVKTNADNVNVNVKSYIYTYTSGRTLPVNKTMLSSGIKGNSNVSPELLYKIKPSKTGTISVSITEYGMSSSAAYVTLYNSKKKAISSKLWYYSKSGAYRAYFGVKANTTYYIKITDARGSYASQYKYGVKYTNTKVTDRNLSKKSKAKTIKRKKSMSTVFVASTGKSVDWYKIKVSKKRKTQIKIYTSGIKSGNLYVTVYKGKKKIGSTKKIPYYANSFTGTITYGTSYGKANKGTYYIKVQQGAKSSGKYSIKYVK
ncbi:hypothetical protein [Anaerofustis stercorihominis]|uniref:hypothetical protein n=1 Tax=Anaerofustis stercorihominis TaxID=214853 RepID=UPI00214AFCAB|nr:hypothetical protein [Anaerofustis stercorihominis]MCR2032497.1 hypothetical protein [Anaerofustis stercorihominis]